MILYPQSGRLTTAAGQLIKHLHCPLNKQWEQLEVAKPAASSRRCAQCEQSVVATDGFTDEALLLAVQQNPKLCLAVSFAQENVTIRFWEDE